MISTAFSEQSERSSLICYFCFRFQFSNIFYSNTLRYLDPISMEYFVWST